MRSQIHALPVALSLREGESWRPHHIFDGKTAALHSLSCHASIVAGGCSPHSLHAHAEEEILMVWSGEIDVIVGHPFERERTIRKRLRKGECAYYPAHFAHTLENVTPEPATYKMFKWRGAPRSSRDALSFGSFDALSPLNAAKGERGLSQRLVFEGATEYLNKLHCHTTVLAPGGGYPPHADSYDVAILVAEGEVQTLGQRVKAPAVIFYEAGSPHGVCNPAETLARYVVFEFRGCRNENAVGSAIKKIFRSSHQREK